MMEMVHGDHTPARSWSTTWGSPVSRERNKVNFIVFKLFLFLFSNTEAKLSTILFDLIHTFRLKLMGDTR